MGYENIEGLGCIRLSELLRDGSERRLSTAVNDAARLSYGMVSAAREEPLKHTQQNLRFVGHREQGEGAVYETHTRH